MPYYINNEEIKNFDKEYDLCTCCSWNKRISEIYPPLSQIYKSCSIGNPAKWGDERDDILFRSKVLINLHHREKDYNILQELRITLKVRLPAQSMRTLQAAPQWWFILQQL